MISEADECRDDELTYWIISGNRSKIMYKYDYSKLVSHSDTVDKVFISDWLCARVLFLCDVRPLFLFIFSFLFSLLFLQSSINFSFYKPQ